jgi:hypothetical protein
MASELYNSRLCSDRNYLFLNRPFSATIGTSLALGAIGSVIANVLGYTWVKLTDKLPISLAQLAERHNKETQLRCRELVDNLRRTRAKITVNEKEIAVRLQRLASTKLDERLAADEALFGGSVLSELNALSSKYRDLRAEYVSILNAAVEDANVALGRAESTTVELEKIAASVREEEISPSFVVLDATRRTYESVQERLNAITF